MKLLLVAILVLISGESFAKNCIKKKKNEECKAPYVAVDNGGIVDCCKDFDEPITTRCDDPISHNCGVAPQPSDD